MSGVFAKFERAMVVERVNSGLARAKAKGVKLGQRQQEGRQAKCRRKTLGTCFAALPRW